MPRPRIAQRAMRIHEDYLPLDEPCFLFFSAVFHFHATESERIPALLGHHTCRGSSPSRLRAFAPSHVIHLSLKHHAPHLRDLEAPEGDEENHETTLLTGRVG